ncbi:MAG: response regulator [Caldilineaceae bacterium]|nr:response regulator [Caldilineaceae bacterium]
MVQQNIRQMAEAVISETLVQTWDISSEQLAAQELRQILHELRVHQIELEMQNEELRRVQVSLAQTRKEYFDLYNFAPVAYLTLDRQGLIHNINLCGADLLDRTQRYLLKRPFLSHVSPQYHMQFVEYLDEVMKCQGRVQTEVGLAINDRYVALDAVAATTEHQELICRMAMTDITHLRQVEQSLRVEKEQLNVTLHAIADGVIVTNAAGVVRLINPPALAMLKTTEAAVLGQPLLSILPIFDEKTNQCLTPLLLQSMTCPPVMLPQTALLRTTDHAPLWVTLSASPIQDGATLLGMIVVFHDETVKRQQQAEELRTQKLEALGTLAGGIAHDFNNLLAGFFGRVDIARRFLSPEHRAYRSLDSAMRSLERATGLTAQLLTFAQGGDPIKEPLSVEDIITEAANFSLHGSNVKLHMNFVSDLYPVAADRGQIGQAISNLVINAQQAMPTGGILTIAAQNIEQATDCYVQITVQDEGVGIAPQHLAHIFDPYFTTKQKGSGLGLTVTHSIIQKHNGTIAVDSKVNQGTTVTICLPACPHCRQADTDTAPVTDPIDALPPARILVVDDEEVVREALVEALDMLGHQAIFAVDGEEAVEAYRNAHAGNAPYDLVITDLTIPGSMGGQAATQAILQINPAAKVIVSSGYATDPVLANYEQHGFAARIVKPYRLAELQTTLHRVLQSD